MKARPNQIKIMLVAMNGDGPTTGFAVRVMLIGKTLSDAGFSVTLLRLYPGLRSHGSWRLQMGDDNVRLIEVPIFPMARFPILRKLSYVVATPIISLFAKILRVDLIQAEAHEAGMAVLQRRPANVGVIVDFHGAAAEETDSRRKQTDKPNWLDDAEKICLERADASLVVSPRMVDHLKAKHPQSRQPQYFIVPVNVEEIFFRPYDKQESRRKLGLKSDELVYVYSGGAQDYQCVEEMAKLFKILRSKNKRVRLLVISTQKKEFQKIFQDVCPEYLPEIVLKSVRKSGVPELLVAGDAAFLLRRDEILNHVSCPTKFGEYLACGLPVITTAWAGHAPSIVRSHDVGVIVDFDLIQAAAVIDSYLIKLSEDVSIRCRATAKELMCWEHSARSLNDCYRWMETTRRAIMNTHQNLNDGAAR